MYGNRKKVAMPECLGYVFASSGSGKDVFFIFVSKPFFVRIVALYTCNKIFYMTGGKTYQPTYPRRRGSINVIDGT